MASALMTDRLIRNLVPEGERQELWDTAVPGLGLRYSTRKRTWFYAYHSPERFDGEGRRRRVRLSLGDYPAKSLTQARTEAAELREKLSCGVDPSVSRPQPAKELLFRDLAREYIEREAKVKKARWDNDVSALRTSLLPAFGDRLVVSITAREIRELLDRLTARGPWVPFHTLAILRRILQWGIEEYELPSNPARLISRPARPPRHRVLTATEVRKLWEQCEAPGSAADLLLPLRLVTAQRETQLLQLNTAQLERNALGLWWNVPAAFTKTRRPYRVFLGPLAEEVLSRIEPDSQGAYFKSFRLCRTRIYPQHLNRVRKGIGSTDWKPLDLRRTAATWMAQRGVPRFVLKRVLGHADHDITAVYDLYSYDKEVRTAVLILDQAVREAIGREPLTATEDDERRPGTDQWPEGPFRRR